MKRIHLFEFEDLSWFPNWIRMCMTRYINTIHKLLGSETQIVSLLNNILKQSNTTHIIDICSGSGGPMPSVFHLLRTTHGYKNLKLTLSDLYPNLEVLKSINSKPESNINYLETPLDATNLNQDAIGLRTMICSMHHMPPNIARDILKDAKEQRQPIFIYEISDNSFPTWLWWIAFPINIITTLVVTLLVRPMSWQQIVFTYLIPILPFLIAWDGAVSNVRTYTLEDMDILLKDLNDEHYRWEKGAIKGKGSNKLYLIGIPT